MGFSETTSLCVCFFTGIAFFTFARCSENSPDGLGVYHRYHWAFLTIRGLVFVIERYRSEPNKFAWFIGLLFVFCPIPTSMASLHLMVEIKGFELLP